MMIKKILLGISSLFLATQLCAAQPIKNIVFLGDSLSDNGNIYKLFHIAPKSPPYYQGRFSNGPTWAEIVADKYASKYAISSKNYAYGGATALLHDRRTDKFIAPMLLGAELTNYYIDTLFKDRSNTLFALWIGANDYLYDTKDPNVLTNDVVQVTSDAITQLIARGARNFLILNMPDLGTIPIAQTQHNAANLHQLSVLHNTKLAAAITKIQAAHPEVKIAFFDIYNLFTDVMTNTSNYNEKYHLHVSDTTSPCWTGTIYDKQTNLRLLNAELRSLNSDKAKGFDPQPISETLLSNPMLKQAVNVGAALAAGAKVCADPDSYLFWDEVHPNRLVHQILGGLVFETLEKDGLA